MASKLTMSNRAGWGFALPAFVLISTFIILLIVPSLYLVVEAPDVASAFESFDPLGTNRGEWLPRHTTTASASTRRRSPRVHTHAPVTRP